MQSLNQTLKIKTFGEFKGRNGSLRIARNGRQKYVEVHSDTFQIHKPRLTKRAVSIQHRMRLDILWDRGILKLFVWNIWAPISQQPVTMDKWNQTNYK